MRPRLQTKEFEPLFIGDVIDGLKHFKSLGVRARCCITSPPYWGLRNYGMKGQIGLEPNINGYIGRMVEVFRAVRDVLADDGTVWLNLGDCYVAAPAGNKKPSGVSQKSPKRLKADLSEYNTQAKEPGLAQKNLIGMPWRVALALQDDGWILRKDIIWHKPNVMVENVTDRPTGAHEYFFLLAKSPRYFYDAPAIAERAVSAKKGKVRKYHGDKRGLTDAYVEGRGYMRWLNGYRQDTGMRNSRSVWTIPVKGFAGAHFAVFPEALVEPAILAGSAPGDYVLDPFLGSGTVARVARRFNRQWFGCELNPEFAKLIDVRVSGPEAERRFEKWIKQGKTW